MASVRGILNIQSLNELTYENFDYPLSFTLGSDVRTRDPDRPRNSERPETRANYSSVYHPYPKGFILAFSPDAHQYGAPPWHVAH